VQYHPIAIRTDDPKDLVEGVVFEMRPEELNRPMTISE